MIEFIQSIIDWFKSAPGEVVGTVVVSVLGFLGIFITQWTMFCIAHMKQNKVQRNVEEINDAVNHRHKRGDDCNVPPKLYDLAWENHQKIDGLVNWKVKTDDRLSNIEDAVKEKK